MTEYSEHATSVYNAWVAADKAFSDALQAEYRGRAGDVRCYPQLQTPAIRKLGDAYANLGQAWHNEWRLATGL